MDKQVLNEIKYYLSHTPVYPKVFISYERNAFFAKDNPDFRVTFDSQVLTRRNNLYLEDGGFGDDVVGKGKYLMEVKILGAIPLWFTSILSELEIYPTHFSKYGNEFMNHCLMLNKENEKQKNKK
jgi:VTC domain.